MPYIQLPRLGRHLQPLADLQEVPCVLPEPDTREDAVGARAGEHARTPRSSAVDRRARVRLPAVLAPLPCMFLSLFRVYSVLSHRQNCGAPNIRKIEFGWFVRLCSKCFQTRYACDVMLRARMHSQNILQDHMVCPCLNGRRPDQGQLDLTQAVLSERNDLLFRR